MQGGCWLRWAIALAAIHFVLVLPDRPEAFRLAAFLVLPVELPFVLAVLLASPSRWRRATRCLVAVALALLLVMKIADIAMFAALGRPFNAVLDAGLALYGVDLLARAFGVAGAAVLLLLAGIGIAAVVATIVWALGAPGSPSAVASNRRRRAVPACAAVGLAAVAWHGMTDAPGVTGAASRFAADHAMLYAAGVADLDSFRKAAAHDRFGEVPNDRLLARLAGTDVLLVFVESYGRSAIDAQTGDVEAKTALDELDKAVARAGFAARTGWLTSPVRGGQSWLAHATLLSGLWVANQRRFDSLVGSDRATLVHDFARAGWRTVAVMPAITFDWPPEAFYGYDRFYGAGDLGYRGAPFNWVTMPDQYTLSVVGGRILNNTERPMMAEIALISSHAPWTPVPPLLPWQEIGDGAVFTPYATRGDPPDTVWRDPARVRSQYRKSIAYVLRTLAGFIERYVRRNMLVIIVGDHQPVPFVSGDPQVREVPIHIISGYPPRLAPADSWGWTAGIVPDAATPVWRMDEFRDRFLEAFTPSAVSSRRSGRVSSATPRR